MSFSDIVHFLSDLMNQCVGSISYLDTEPSAKQNSCYSYQHDDKEDNFGCFFLKLSFSELNSQREGSFTDSISPIEFIFGINQKWTMRSVEQNQHTDCTNRMILEITLYFWWFKGYLMHWNRCIAYYEKCGVLGSWVMRNIVQILKAERIGIFIILSCVGVS